MTPIQQYVKSFTDGFTSAGSAVSSAIGTSISWVSTQAKSAVAAASGAIQSGIGEKAEALKARVGTAAANLSAGVTNKVDTTVTSMREKYNSIRSSIAEFQMMRKVASKLSNVRSLLQDLETKKANLESKDKTARSLIDTIKLGLFTVILAVAKFFTEIVGLIHTSLTVGNPSSETAKQPVRTDGSPAPARAASSSEHNSRPSSPLSNDGDLDSASLSAQWRVVQHPRSSSPSSDGSSGGSNESAVVVDQSTRAPSV